jgi:UDPglucose 6-dehydrogenase
MRMNISVIGLGKLGAPLAAVLASKGFEVVGTDLNLGFVDAVNAGLAPVDEPGLQELIDAHRPRLRATADVGDAVASTDVTFIIVPTPSDATGRFSNDYVLSALEQVGAALRLKNSYHVVVITSTVMPGSTDGVIRDTLERYSGRAVGADLGLCYNPEFIALGSVIRDMLNPDMLLIGESDEQAGDVLEHIYLKTCDNEPVVRRMNFVNAELAKISVNTFVTTKISYANMLADICDRLPGADVDVVTRAIGCDARIGGKYLRGATGYGGPCFPRDNVAFATLARSIGARAELAEATDALNRYQIERVVGAVQARFSSGIVGVLGLSYKPETPVVEQSQGVALVDRLLADGHRVTAYDPKALPAAQAAIGRRFDAASSAEACVAGASLVVVMTPWQEFKNIPLAAFAREGTRLCVIDCWRILSRESIGDVAEVVYLGEGAAGGATVMAQRRAVKLDTAADTGGNATPSMPKERTFATSRVRIPCE